MRLCWLVVICACGSDPTLAVSVTHPLGLSVAKTTVTVYESSTLHCTDIEFSRVDPVGLEALETAEADVMPGATGALTGISRTDNKVIVARGFDASGMLISAGCTEKAVVEGNASVSITTMIAAIVSIRPPTDPASLEVAVSLTDASGVPLSDPRPVTWTVSGPAGSTAANPSNTTSTGDGEWEPALPSCTANGVLKVNPNPPSVLGGYAVQVRAAWAVEQPNAYTSLAATTFAPIDLGSGVTLSTARRACAIKSGGHLVCADTNNQLHEYAITASNGQAVATPIGAAVSAFTLPAQNVIAVLAIAGNIYAVSQFGNLVPAYGAPATDTSANCAACTDAMAVPACGGIGAKVLMAQFGKTVHQVDAQGKNPTTFEIPNGSTVRLDNAGCVTQLQTTGVPVLGQLATIHGGTSAVELALSGTFLVNCSSGQCGVLEVPLTRGAGVGFTGGTEPRIVAATVDATGVVLVSDVFSTNGGTVERARMSAVSIPEHIVVGQVDADTDADMFWDVAARNGSTSFEIAYGRKINNQNLEALSAGVEVDVSDLEIGDLTGDGHDDLVIISSAGVTVIPMGVAIPAPTPNSDPTCMP